MLTFDVRPPMIGQWQDIWPITVVVTYIQSNHVCMIEVCTRHVEPGRVEPRILKILGGTQPFWSNIHYWWQGGHDKRSALN